MRCTRTFLNSFVNGNICCAFVKRVNRGEEKIFGGLLVYEGFGMCQEHLLIMLLFGMLTIEETHE